MWSARRAPAVFEREAERSTQRRVHDILTLQLAQIVAPQRACIAVDGPTGPLVRVGSDLALAPASTLKLLTATAAISLLGADHRFTTRVLSDGNGDLVVVGGGDPLLATPEHIEHEHAQPRFRDAPFTSLAALADAIVASGTRTVRGALLVDDSAHDTLRSLPDWKAIYAQEGDIGALGALTVDAGFADPEGRTPSADPAVTTGERLATLLAARGVTIAGGVRRGRAPEGTSAREIAHVDSPPLGTMVGEMLTSSDNYTAEELVRDLAAHASPDRPATTELGIGLVVHELTALGVPTDRVEMHDGSGLAPADRVTCATMLQVIELAAKPKFGAVDRGLAVAGRSGTLAERFVGDALAGKLRAKTGSIGGVVGLVGVIDRPDRIHFAFVANGNFSDVAGAALQIRVADAIGATPDLRAPPGLVPAP